jgi:general secretion pathway protein G
MTTVIKARQMAIRRKKSGESGFTLMELMIVMLIIGVLLAIAVPNYTSAVKVAKEAVLKEDLHIMRQAIDSYTMDKQKAPQSLQDLVEGGYLKAIPSDPMTRSTETWVTDQSDALRSVDQSDPGIDNVHSGAEQQGSDGQPYTTW